MKRFIWSIRVRFKKCITKSEIINDILKSRDRKIIYKRLKKQDPIFIYQMGKVASTSVYQSLKEYYNNGSVFHAHYFESPHRRIPIVGYFYDYYHKEKPPIKLISLVREPISRNISFFFQNIKYFMDVKLIREGNYRIEELKEIFLTKVNHDVPLVWFDNHIKKEFDIDIYQYNFPKDNYQIIKKGNVELLLMKHDLDDKIKESVLMKFLSISNFKLKSSNVGSTKFYKKTYKEMRELSYPEAYINRMLNSKYTNHFYREEIEHINSKWINTSKVS